MRHSAYLWLLLMPSVIVLNLFYAECHNEYNYVECYGAHCIGPPCIRVIMNCLIGYRLQHVRKLSFIDLGPMMQSYQCLLKRPL